MLFSGVSFVPIALLNPEFFASEEQKEQRQELFILAVVISRFRDQNVIGEEKNLIFPETRQKMLSNAVSLVPILLLSAEIFAFEKM